MDPQKSISRVLKNNNQTLIATKRLLTFLVLRIILVAKSNLSLYSLYYAELCNEFAEPISVSLRPGNAAPFEEMSQRWRAVGNTVRLASPRFEPQTSRSRVDRVTT